MYKQLRMLEWSPSVAQASEILDSASIPEADNTTPVWGVILEPRDHPLLEYVVRNVQETLNIPIQIFHGKNARQSILDSSIGQLVEDGSVVLTGLTVDSLYPGDFHNAFILTEEFWNAMAGRNKILFFQTDTIVCQSRQYDLEDFLEYDYIASAWRPTRPNNLVVHGGCGGLSVRDWKMSVACIRRFPPDYWEGGEDAYFGFFLDVMGGKVASEAEGATFSTERIFTEKSFGAHQITNLEPKSLASFLEYCPEAKPLLEYA